MLGSKVESEKLRNDFRPTRSTANVLPLLLRLLFYRTYPTYSLQNPASVPEDTDHIKGYYLYASIPRKWQSSVHLVRGASSSEKFSIQQNLRSSNIYRTDGDLSWHNMVLIIA